MKNLLLLLILANILYFMWGMFATEDPRPGVAVVEESDLGPPLDVKAGAIDDTGAGDAELGSGQLSDLDAVVGRSCVTIGPFKAVGDADTAVLEYTGEGMKAVRRRGVAQVFIGHSVQVENVASRAAGREMIGKLAEQGLSDAFIVGNDESGYAIALGIFGQIENAEKVELQARAAGYEVEISPMMRDADVFCVDIGLPPGRGAGTIIEHYGEDLVALRDAATCPH
jgi:hypothetical protein